MFGHVTGCLTGGKCKYERETIIICLFVLSEFSLYQCYPQFLVIEQQARCGNSFHVPAMGSPGQCSQVCAQRAARAEHCPVPWGSGGCPGLEKSLKNPQFIKFGMLSQRIKRIAKSSHFTWSEKKSRSHMLFPQMCSSGLNLPSKLSLTSPWRGEMKHKSLGCRSWIKISHALRSYISNML